MESTASPETPPPSPPKEIPRKPVPQSPLIDATPSKPRPTRSFAPLVYLGVTLLGTTIFKWRWTLSGMPLLVCALTVGDWNGRRIFPLIPLWSIVTLLSITYAVASTSWVLYYSFVAGCYFTTLLSSIYQFSIASSIVRRYLSNILRECHFVQDTISLFDLPALEIDKDTVGLFVLRGLTFSLSTLTATAYGIEVGIKLDDDMELAIQTDKVVIALFRRITIGDVYANVKGREEMTFKDVNQFPNERDMSKDTFIAKDTLLLKAAFTSAKEGFSEIQEELEDSVEDPESDRLVRRLSPDEEKARAEVKTLVRHILNTSTSRIAGEMLKKIAKEREIDDILQSDNNFRAAVCTHVHDQPTVAHPPTKSIRLTTLSHNNHPKIKK